LFRHWRTVLAIIGAVFITGAVAVNAAAGQSEKSTGVVSPTPEAEKAEREKSGKISKEEWMKFMEAEFDRLDADDKGQLNVKELTQSRVRIHPYVGK
jgi:hypothetical protein